MRKLEALVSTLACAGALWMGNAASASSRASYMIVDLRTGDVTYENGNWSDYTNETYKTVKMAFRKVSAGTYNIQDGNLPEATMARDFYIGIYEVTAGQFALMQDPGATVAVVDDSMKPAVGVSYNMLRGTFDAAVAPTSESPIGRLSAIVRTAAGDSTHTFDLPTEAMWEIAARAMPSGDDSRASWPWFFGHSASMLDDYAWHVGNSGSTTHVVGQKEPNAWGLYDMYGNVSEWCRDHWSWNGFVPTQEGNTAATGRNRSLRGGSFEHDAYECTSGVRMNAYCTDGNPVYGFRLSLVMLSEEGGCGDPECASLNGAVRITEWRFLGRGEWRLVFTTPVNSLKGAVGDLVPNRSFALQFSCRLPGTCCGSCACPESSLLDFIIDDASVKDGLLAVTVTATITNMCHRGNGFVKVVSP